MEVVSIERSTYSGKENIHQNQFLASPQASGRALAGTTTCKGVQLVKLKKLKTKVPITTGFR